MVWIELLLSWDHSLRWQDLTVAEVAAVLVREFRGIPSTALSPPACQWEGDESSMEVDSQSASGGQLEAPGPEKEEESVEQTSAPEKKGESSGYMEVGEDPESSDAMPLPAVVRLQSPQATLSTGASFRLHSLMEALDSVSVDLGHGDAMATEGGEESSESDSDAMVIDTTSF